MPVLWAMLPDYIKQFSGSDFGRKLRIGQKVQKKYSPVFYQKSEWKTNCKVKTWGIKTWASTIEVILKREVQ